MNQLRLCDKVPYAIRGLHCDLALHMNDRFFTAWHYPFSRVVILVQLGNTCLKWLIHVLAMVSFI